MKALIYKEFKLAMHPICYVFMVLFPFMLLIPSFPLGISFIYALVCYPILFLGANKGQQSNDLLYSTLLPVRKKDIVLARIFTVSIIQFFFVFMMLILYPLAFYLQKYIISVSEVPPVTPGLNFEGIVSIIGIGLIGFSIADLIFFPIYYKKGRSIVMSTLFMIFGFAIFIAIFTIVIPTVPGCELYLKYLSTFEYIWIQFILLAVALIIYFLVHFLVYKISAKRLEKVDF